MAKLKYLDKSKYIKSRKIRERFAVVGFRIFCLLLCSGNVKIKICPSISIIQIRFVRMKKSVPFL